MADLPVVDHGLGVEWHIDADATGRQAENTPPLRPLRLVDVPPMFHYTSTPPLVLFQTVTVCGNEYSMELWS